MGIRGGTAGSGTIGLVAEASRVSQRDVGEAPAASRTADRSVADHLITAALVLVVGLPLAWLARVGSGPLLAGVAVAQAILAVAWMLRPGVSGWLGGMVVGVAAAAAADLVIAAWPRGQLSSLLAVLGLSVTAMFVHQLTRGVMRTRVTSSLSDVAVLVVAVVALPALVALRHETGGQAMATAVVLAMTAAICASHVIDAVWPVPRLDVSVAYGLLAVLVGTVVAAVVGYLRLHSTVEFSVGRSILVGAAVGVVTTMTSIGVGYLVHRTEPAGWAAASTRLVVAATLPFAIAAPVAYLLCLAVRG
jgi:hypothetical protein